jgi:hypothetical protein
MFAVVCSRRRNDSDVCGGAESSGATYPKRKLKKLNAYLIVDFAELSFEHSISG